MAVRTSLFAGALIFGVVALPLGETSARVFEVTYDDVGTLEDWDPWLDVGGIQKYDTIRMTGTFTTPMEFRHSINYSIENYYWSPPKGELGPLRRSGTIRHSGGIDDLYFLYDYGTRPPLEFVGQIGDEWLYDLPPTFHGFDGDGNRFIIGGTAPAGFSYTAEIVLTPIPAAGPIFVTGLIALYIVRRRSRAAAKA